jgi:hypothetical protein
VACADRIEVARVHVIRFDGKRPPYAAYCETCGAAWMDASEWVASDGCPGRKETR